MSNDIFAETYVRTEQEEIWSSKLLVRVLHEAGSLCFESFHHCIHLFGRTCPMQCAARLSSLNQSWLSCDCQGIIDCFRLRKSQEIMDELHLTEFSTWQIKVANSTSFFLCPASSKVMSISFRVRAVTQLDCSKRQEKVYPWHLTLWFSKRSSKACNGSAMSWYHLWHLTLIGQKVLSNVHKSNYGCVCSCHSYIKRR